MAPLIATLNVMISKKVRKELVSNGGLTMKDTVHRTETTLSAVADTLNVPHEPPPTPASGIPVTH